METGDIIKTSGVIGRMAGIRSTLVSPPRHVGRKDSSDVGQSVFNSESHSILCFTLQSQPTRVMRTHWELSLWGYWWTTWRYNQGKDPSTFALQVIYYLHVSTYCFLNACLGSVFIQLGDWLFHLMFSECFVHLIAAVKYLLIIIPQSSKLNVVVHLVSRHKRRSAP